MNCCKRPRWTPSPHRREHCAKMTKPSQGLRDFNTRFAEPIHGTRHDRTKPTRPADGSENVRRRESRTTERTQQDFSNFATTLDNITTFNRTNTPGKWLETIAGRASGFWHLRTAALARPYRNATITGRLDLDAGILPPSTRSSRSETGRQAVVSFGTESRAKLVFRMPSLAILTNLFIR